MFLQLTRLLGILGSSRLFFALHFDGRTVFPPPLSAAEEKANFELMAAGDSVFDISMLSAAAESFCPEALAPFVHTHGKLHICTGRFSDSLCGEIEKIITEEKLP